jgi:hypothetical protein
MLLSSYSREHAEMSQGRTGRTRRIPLDIHGLSGRVEIFRVTRTSKRDPSVDEWLNGEPVELRSIAQRWFLQMRSCGEDVREALLDGCPVACVEDAPFAYVNTFTNHVNVGFFYGALLEDAAGLLEGSGKRMRHVKLSTARAVNAAALGALIVTAYKDIKSREQ